MGVVVLDDKLFDLMEKMYIEFSKRFDNMESDINGLKTDVGDIKLDVESLKTNTASLKTNITKINTTIEHELMPKITVLLDGYKQNSDKLDRIEKEVSKHEEIILRRVK